MKCGAALSRLPHDLSDGYQFHCECGCGRSWELRRRTRRLTYAFWLRTVPCRDGSRVWVLTSPLKPPRGRFGHAELLAADERERG